MIELSWYGFAKEPFYEAIWFGYSAEGPSYLVAACRVIVKSHIGETVPSEPDKVEKG